MSNPCVHFSCLRPGCELDRVFPQDCRRGCSAYSPVEYFVACALWDKAHISNHLEVGFSKVVSVEARVSG